MADARSRVTLADVARAAGVDVSLVSKVVRGQGNRERPETRERILRFADELGYRPNMVARSLRTSRAGAFGLVIPNFTNPVYAEIIAGAEAAAAELGSVILTGSGAGWGRGDWYTALSGGRVDALLIAGADVDPGTLDVPFLLVNRRPPDATRFLILDDEHAAELAVDHLVEIGHRRIAHLGGPPAADTAQRRLAGYRAALARHGIEHEPSLEVGGDYTAAGAVAATRLLIERRPDVTALFVANFASALGAYKAIGEAGRRIPEDVSLVAVHDAELAGYLQPPLTTVRMPLAELGARAIGLVAQQAPTAPITEILRDPITLVVRGSTAPPPRHG